ncbi:MAG: hypothetical protein ABI566_06895 [Pseudolysinimonas sp.]
MDIQESWQRATELLIASHDVWDSDELTAVFPDGLERTASAIVATIGVDGVTWVETRSDLEAPKVEAAVFNEESVAHIMLTAEGFGFEVRRLQVESVRATSIPYVHPDESEHPFRFTARFTALEVSFPWDSDNLKQDDRIPEQFARLLKRL